MTVTIRRLHVQLGSFTLGPLDLDFGPGITAILGPNGSGKTTLLRSMHGLIPQASGDVSVLGSDLRARSHEALRRSTFVADAGELLFDELTIHEYWRFLADVRERSFGDRPLEIIARAYELASRLQLEPGRSRIREFSLGMRKKAQLITGMMFRPDVLFVDEPQNGLDYISSQEIRTIFGELRADGVAIIMSNHDLDSVARVADRIVILQAGRVAAASENVFASSAACELYVQEFFGHV